MKRRFQIVVRGTVESLPEFSHKSEEDQVAEMKAAVEQTGQDTQWGVTIETREVRIYE